MPVLPKGVAVHPSVLEQLEELIEEPSSMVPRLLGGMLPGVRLYSSPHVHRGKAIVFARSEARLSPMVPRLTVSATEMAEHLPPRIPKAHMLQHRKRRVRKKWEKRLRSYLYARAQWHARRRRFTAHVFRALYGGICDSIRGMVLP